MNQPAASAVEAPTAGPTLYRWRWIVLAVVLTAQVLDLLDATIVGIAAPAISADLGAAGTDVQWFAAGYTLAFAVGLITGGRLGDLYGLRRMFLAGLTGFVLASVLSGLAQSPEMLICSRVLQGLCGALLIPQGFGIVKSVFPKRELGTAFGAFGPVGGIAAIIGPILSGALIAADLGGLGWRTVFFINVPIGLVCLVFALRLVPETRSPASPRPDPVGVLLVTVGLLLLVFPLVQGREAGWPFWTYVAMIASIPVLVLFGTHQVRRTDRGRTPLVEPTLFRSRSYVGALLLGLFFFAALTGLVLILGIYLQQALGFSALRAGLTQAPWALGVALGAVLSGSWLGPRFGRAVMQAGAFVMILGLVGFASTLRLVTVPVSAWMLAPSLLVAGFGMGLLIAPYFGIALTSVSMPMVGAASGVLNANQQLGGSVGIAVLGTIYYSALDPAQPLLALDAVLAAAAGLLIVCALLVLLLPRRARGESTAADGESDSTEPTDDGATHGADAADPPAVAGVVRSSLGTPSEGAVLTLTDTQGRFIETVVSAADGTYALHADSEGKHLLVCASREHAPQAEYVTIGRTAAVHDVVLGASPPSAVVTRR